jgi:hypothetical protein
LAITLCRRQIRLHIIKQRLIHGQCFSDEVRQKAAVI